MLGTVKMWIVPFPDEQASHRVNLSKVIEKISALSEPLLSSQRAPPSSVEKILIRVPLSLAVARIVPSIFRAMHESEF